MSTDTGRRKPGLWYEIRTSLSGDNTFDHWSHPVGFWVWIGAVLAVDALLWWGATELTDPGLARFMLAGVLCLATAVMLAPTCLDLTGYTLFVSALVPLGLVLLIGSPLVYALWVAFVGPHVEVTIK